MLSDGERRGNEHTLLKPARTTGRKDMCMQKASENAIALLHFGTLPGTVVLLNEGHFSTAFWHSLAAGGSVQILVIVSALTYIITNKAGASSRKRSTRKSGRRQSNKRKPTRKSGVRSKVR
jgi:hypothetical protein